MINSFILLFLNMAWDWIGLGVLFDSDMFLTLQNHFLAAFTKVNTTIPVPDLAYT